jgi:Uma2 family endonuclease
MVEYVEYGARLGLLLDAAQKRDYVYKPGEPVRELAEPEKVSADPVLPGFVLKPREVW